MSDFSRELVAVMQNGKVGDLEDRMIDKIAETQTTLENGDGNSLIRAQGFMQALTWFLALPGEVVQEAKTEGQTTEE